MQARIVDGKATSATHFVLGLDAFSRGNSDDARLHWEQAFRLEPNAAIVANNLAWMLAHGDCPDLTRALELANRAVEHRPKQPRFRGTRAFVLLKLNRWPEALTDLEASLASRSRTRSRRTLIWQMFMKSWVPPSFRHSIATGPRFSNKPPANAQRTMAQPKRRTGPSQP